MEMLSDYQAQVNSLVSSDILKNDQQRLLLNSLNSITMPKEEQQRNCWNQLECIDWMNRLLKDDQISLVIKSKVLEILAELSKDENIRESLGPKFIPPVVQLLFATKNLSDEQDETFKQILRVLANFTYDHDRNREIIDEIPGAIEKIATVLQSCKPEVISIGFSALFNISMDHENLQSKLNDYGMVRYLLQYIADIPMNENSLLDPSPAALLLSNILESGSAVNNLVIEENLDLFVICLQKAMAGICSELTEHVQTVAEIFIEMLENMSSQDIFQRAVLSKRKFGMLCAILEACHAEDVNQEINDLLSTFGKALSSVSSHDNAMVVFKEERSHFEIISKWLNFSATSKNMMEKQMFACLIIGNIARSDDTCEILMENSVILDSLQSIIEYQLAICKSLTENDLQNKLRDIVRLLHAAIGAIRNLTVPIKKRVEIGEETRIIEIVSELLMEDKFEALHLSCLGILRNLILSYSKSVRSFLVKGNDNSLESLYSYLMKKVSKYSTDEYNAMRTEIGRFTVALIRSAVLNSDQEVLDCIESQDFVPVLMEIITGAALMKPGGIDGITSIDYKAEYLSGGAVYPVVQNEGLIAFILFCQTRPQKIIKHILRFETSFMAFLMDVLETEDSFPSFETSSKESSALQTSQLSEEEEVTKSLTNEQSNQKYSDEMRINAIILMHHILSFDDSFGSRCPPSLLQFIIALKRRLKGLNLDQKNDDQNQNVNSQGVEDKSIHMIQQQSQVIDSVVSLLDGRVRE